MTDRELMQQALDVLTDCGQLHPDNYKTFKDDVIAALRERLAQPEDRELEQRQYQRTADKCKLETVPAKGGLLPAQEEPWEQLHPDMGNPFARQEQQEPVAWEDVLGAIARGWTHPENERKTMDVQLVVAIAKEVQLLFTAPQRREWVGLTDEEMHECWDSPLTPLGMKYVRAIEAKLKEKNA